MKDKLKDLKMPSKKKDPMLDLEATLAEIGSEKPDSEMNEMEDMESPEYEKEVSIEMEGGEEEGEGKDLSMFTDEELQKELDKRLSMASAPAPKAAKKFPKM
jgi:hypothetical protein